VMRQLPLGRIAEAILDACAETKVAARA